MPELILFVHHCAELPGVRMSPDRGVQAHSRTIVHLCLSHCMSVACDTQCERAAVDAGLPDNECRLRNALIAVIHHQVHHVATCA